MAISRLLQQDSRDSFGIPFRRWLWRDPNAAGSHSRFGFNVGSYAVGQCSYPAATGQARRVLLPNPDLNQGQRQVAQRNDPRARKTPCHTSGAVRYFNTESPVVADEHYCIPPLERGDLYTTLRLIERKEYLMLNAPRQTGKTTFLLALAHRLNSSAKFRCVYVNFEPGRAAEEDRARALRAIVHQLGTRAHLTLGDEYVASIKEEALQVFGPDGALMAVPVHRAGADSKPMVLLIDEIDALVGGAGVARVLAPDTGASPASADSRANLVCDRCGTAAEIASAPIRIWACWHSMPSIRFGAAGA